MPTLLKMRETRTRTTAAHVLRHALDETSSTCGFTAVVVDEGLRILEHDGITWHGSGPAGGRAERPTGSTRGQELAFSDLDNLAGQVVRGAAPIVINDPRDARLAKLPLVAYPPLHSFLCVPVFDGDEVVGVIGVANRFDGYTTQDRERLQMVAGGPRTRRASGF